jgi:DNA-binding transcriptional ArsR family regulator
MALNKKAEFPLTESRLAELAKALSHPARISILKLLAKRNTCICGEIVDELPLAQSTVSQHLKELKACGLVQGEIDGPKSCYCINWDTLKDLQDLLGTLFQGMERGNRDKCC